MLDKFKLMILNDFAKKQAKFEIGQRKSMSLLIIRTPEEIEADDKKVEVMIAKSNKQTLAGPTRIEGGLKPNLEQVINQQKQIQKQIDNQAINLKASIISKQLLELSKELQNSIALGLIKENLKERASTAINDARKKITGFKTKFKR